MEILIAEVIIIALLLILGVDALLILKFLMVIAETALIGMLVFFAVSALAVFCAKKQKGNFMRFEKKKLFDSAVYSGENGKEYINIYPAENVNRLRIYTDEEKTLRVFEFRGKGYAADPHTVLIITAGIFLTSASLVLVTVTLKAMLIL